ncbi:MAG: hypothetical protein HYY49_10620 [Ignavibacteriales bacterium]|nr:hypothetical protein [Ignavibacteriales bacterium]
MCSTGKAAFLILIVLLLPISVSSQSRISSALIQRDTSASHEDTLALVSGKIVLIAPPSGKSTTVALLLSAVLPGAGQIYTERYLHAPVVWALGYHLVRQWNIGNNFYRDYGEQYARSVASDTVNQTGNSQLKFIRDFYHDERDRFGLYIIILYVVNLVDAYVGASLYSFEVSDELGGNSAIRLRIRVR